MIDVISGVAFSKFSDDTGRFSEDAQKVTWSNLVLECDAGKDALYRQLLFNFSGGKSVSKDNDNLVRSHFW